MGYMRFYQPPPKLTKVDQPAHVMHAFNMHRISAKNLGSLGLPDACERCFWPWLKTRAAHYAPP